MSRWQEFLAFLFGRKYVQLQEHYYYSVKPVRWRDYEGRECLSVKAKTGILWLFPDGTVEGNVYHHWKPLNFKVEQ